MVSRNKIFSFCLLSAPPGSQSVGNPFSGANIWTKIQGDPKTREFLKDPQYKKIIEDLQSNPKALG